MKIREKADIVVADAYPADVDFWQAVKGLNAARGAVRDGGTIVLVTPCPEGASDHHPELTSLGFLPPDQLERMVNKGELDKVASAMLFLGGRLLQNAHAILVTKGISEHDTRAMGLDWAPDPQAALEKAFDRHGRAASVNVLYKAAEMICRI